MTDYLAGTPGVFLREAMITNPDVNMDHWEAEVHLAFEGNMVPYHIQEHSFSPNSPSPPIIIIITLDVGYYY